MLMLTLACFVQIAGAAILKPRGHQGHSPVDFHKKGVKGGGLLQKSHVRGRNKGRLSDIDDDKETSDTARLKMEYPYYHTSDEISEHLKNMEKTCQGATLKTHTVEDNGVEIQYVTVEGHNSSAINKVFLLSGEHARELIGPESTLKMLQALCGADGGNVQSSVSVAEVLKTSSFMVVVNGNPRSRLAVEKGDYCVRANENGVDLNRNWDEEWDQQMTLTTDRGTEPFSEPETRMFKKLTEEFEPTTFLSVHSGTLGMYMPWAWSEDELARRNQEKMMDVLRTLDADHCQCPFGAAGHEVGYPCPGTSVDYVYDKLKASYSFAFEIWGDPADADSLRKRWQEKMDEGGAVLLQTGAQLNHPHFQSVFGTERHPSDFLQLANTLNTSSLSTVTTEENREMCFGTFNPKTEEDFKKNVHNWAAAYLEMSHMIAKELASGESN